MVYRGIELTAPDGAVQMSHSHAFDIIRGESSARNVTWLDALGDLPWGELKDLYPDVFDNACRLFSLANMNYQVCNGGVSQYFFNKYHEYKHPLHENDVAIFDIEEQKKDFAKLLDFAQSVFPERTSENGALSKTVKAFDAMEYEENAACFETIYCDEDEYILDDETGELIENPDYFEPYDDCYHEDVIHGGDSFEDAFYDALEYFEELLELRAQFFCKLFVRDLEKHAEEHPVLIAKVKEVLPISAFSASNHENMKPSLNDQIHSAESRKGETNQANSKEPSVIDH